MRGRAAKEAYSMDGMQYGIDVTNERKGWMDGWKGEKE